MLCKRPICPRGVGRASPLAPRTVLTLRTRLQATQGVDQQLSIAPAAEATAPPVVAPVAPIPETTATYVMPPNPVYYQGMPTPRQEYYMAAPPAAYYPPPPAPYKEEAASSGAPWWIWLGLGVILGQVLAKVQEFMKNPKTPQQIMMEMAMKQMSGAMGGTPGAGMPPFGGAASPFASPTGGAPNPFANFAAAAAASPAVDTTASSVQGSTSTATAPASSSNGEARKGEKFASRLSSEGREPRKVELPPSSKPLDVVEPVVKEPSSSSSSSSSAAASKSRSSFFADVDTEATTTSTSSSSGAASDGGSPGVMSEMMESMLRNPEMQKMLYPYLPEPMRNPQSIEWMLSNPEVKKQMEQMFAQQNVMSPQMMDMMKNMDFNQDKVNRQFAELGLKPEDVISKVMANPELASGFSNPKVQAAILDISSNPMNIMKYQTDPEVMRVLEKVTEIFQPQMNQK
ncbi:hypothetical protein Vretimale_19691 [Volvox reticuliferus]|uniref:Protein TIC 40, chloroplastic n=1 Tax=Volvox reticuliferus TaxID=1737510 RepID=A0A8J4BWI5_9CHLO|nr:hypothetical protein Vretifemale_844 [Volvox reticuliferus]GIM17176.1 hypothetical protein Vretimale_19691 [Volvox reticuliferus]